MAREVISSGNELAAKAAIDAGCKFFGGYPITPSSEIAHEMSVLLPRVGGKFIQMEDEIGGIAVALGASMSGVKSMTNTSGPGISLKAEQIGLGFMTETPLVITNVMRGGPSTGLPTRVQQGDINQAKAPTHGDYKSISFCPGSLEECYTEVVRAFNVAEELMTPVFVLLDETLGHMHGKAVLPDLEEVQASIVDRAKPDPSIPKEEFKPFDVPQDKPAVIPPMFQGYRFHLTGLHHGPTGFPTEDAEICQNLIERLHRKIDSRRKDLLDSYEEYMLDDAEWLIVAYGSVSRSAREAINRLREQGVKIGMFRPITLWPSPEDKMKEIGERFPAEKILMPELNMGQYIDEVERVMKKRPVALNKANGRPISPAEIIEKLQEMGI
ncbi:2-oxoglutarate/2-oxoacid ferredoxin oxidoreductase subunit alpha [Nitratiruptor sp. YY08-26]|uniref:2-oxoglutarate synthase subunit alpha n=1 Tax=unclassified Nitratiruptor TaxID=2624044 RepID=UPI001916395C|nr:MULTISPECIES: 2-oxoglutarate synthase subunit alpha [unclassified Nitratiruptor]BCD62194.1 2-oxoglutarate/2-oxoacid ferredoxin oxidoreductase subunit alpha [Nitratiruptor sp. YY08-13]BCD66130.1 2-oxoglutarate/2-oxoacid ferredoxin oxidoreductase subunit alpha [Nitratiruptor sp. YY08-26]